jgi:hypothetical protein
MKSNYYLALQDIKETPLPMRLHRANVFETHPSLQDPLQQIALQSAHRLRTAKPTTNAANGSFPAEYGGLYRGKC